MAWRVTRTRRGWHYVFLLREAISPIERVAIEAILGDDPMRAAMNLARARNALQMDRFWSQRFDILYDWKMEVE